MIKRYLPFLLFFLLTAFTAPEARGQDRLTKDYSDFMEVPSVVSMESSASHLYLLSESEGLVLFRNSPDSLQWLYSSAGMQRRGYRMTADVRFAYLFGDSRRLTVLEPTSVLGVYSSTRLPGRPLDAVRINRNLYVAMGDQGLGRVDLSTPAAVDSAVADIGRSTLQDRPVIDLETSLSQLFVLTADGNLFIFDHSEDGLELATRLALRQDLDRIFVIGDLLLGTGPGGEIYEIDGTGALARIGSIGEPVTKIEGWKSWLIIKGNSNRLWTSNRNRAPQPWKRDPNAGNYFTVSRDQLWLSEYDQVSRIITAEEAAANDRQPETDTETEPQSQIPASPLALSPIENITVPFPKPVLLPISLEGNFPVDRVQFAYQSNIQEAKIRGNGFYWQPRSEDVGMHRFKIIATSSDGQIDSTAFSIDIRSFNAPPRFSPIRPITIPVGEAFTLPISATDPDGMNPELIRYIGVDLPEGASVNEQNGRFTWTPTARQAGKNSFQVVATDQYGAASQVNVTITVIEISRGEQSQ